MQNNTQNLPANRNSCYHKGEQFSCTVRVAFLFAEMGLGQAEQNLSWPPKFRKSEQNLYLGQADNDD
jgi:hypothetical protein